MLQGPKSLGEQSGPSQQLVIDEGSYFLDHSFGLDTLHASHLVHTVDGLRVVNTHAGTAPQIFVKDPLLGAQGSITHGGFRSVQTNHRRVES